MDKTQEIIPLQSELLGKNPRTILKTALAKYDRIAISFSGAEDVVLIDMAIMLKKEIDVFVLDTGRLHPETYRFLDTVAKHYSIKLDIQYPEHLTLQAFVKQKGLFSFYVDGHEECCKFRKVDPLRRKLSSLDAWITGQRKDQSTQTRSTLPEIQIDDTFSTENHIIVKFNPLTNWTSRQVWDYIEAYDVPFNKLHLHGFKSIGCEPCTRSTAPNQSEREGRWWWEDANKKECGLHGGNIKVQNN